MIKVALFAVLAVTGAPGLVAAEPNLVAPACALPRQEAAIGLSVLRAGIPGEVEAPKERVIDVTLSPQQLNAIRLGANARTR